MVKLVNISTLTPAEKHKALPTVNLAKEKFGGELKGRTCADRSRQRKYSKKDKSVASPTAALESLIESLLIDTYKGRDNSIFCILGGFHQAKLASKENNERVLLKLASNFADAMYQVNSEYKQNATCEMGRKVLCMEVIQVIYRCIESALRWYKLFSETLVKEGWKINPYGKCVANKVINDK